MSDADTDEAPASVTVQSLEFLLSLLRTSRTTAERLRVDDSIAKAELLDGLAVSEVNVLRMLEAEDVGGELSFSDEAGARGQIA